MVLCRWRSIAYVYDFLFRWKAKKLNRLEVTFYWLAEEAYSFTPHIVTIHYGIREGYSFLLSTITIVHFVENTFTLWGLSTPSILWTLSYTASRAVPRWLCNYSSWVSICGHMDESFRNLLFRCRFKCTSDGHAGEFYTPIINHNFQQHESSDALLCTWWCLAIRSLPD